MNQSGFTLLELLVTVLIIGILSAVALPQYRKAVDRARVSEAMEVLPALFDSRERFMQQNNIKWGEEPQEFTQRMLDVEFKGDWDQENGGAFTTKAFFYDVVDGKPVGASDTMPRCVSATPLWLTDAKAKIYYWGNRFFCDDEDDGETCARLSVDYKDGGCK